MRHLGLMPSSSMSILRRSGYASCVLFIISVTPTSAVMGHLRVEVFCVRGVVQVRASRPRHAPVACKCHCAPAPVTAHVCAVEVEGGVMEALTPQHLHCPWLVDVAPSQVAQDGGLACGAENGDVTSASAHQHACRPNVPAPLSPTSRHRLPLGSLKVMSSMAGWLLPL